MNLIWAAIAALLLIALAITASLFSLEMSFLEMLAKHPFRFAIAASAFFGALDLTHRHLKDNYPDTRALALVYHGAVVLFCALCAVALWKYDVSIEGLLLCLLGVAFYADIHVFTRCGGVYFNAARFCFPLKSSYTVEGKRKEFLRLYKMTKLLNPLPQMVHLCAYVVFFAVAVYLLVAGGRPDEWTSDGTATALMHLVLFKFYIWDAIMGFWVYCEMKW